MTDSTQPPRRILVATDFSVNASLALDRATELAKIKGVPLLVVHSTSVETFGAAATAAAALPQDFEAKVRRACEEGLDRLRESVRSEGVEVETRLLTGSPPQTIAELAEREEVSLIVIGARGATGFPHLLLGRIAEEIARIASVPVLTVHPSDADLFEEIERVLVPSDLSESCETVLRAAMELLGPRASEVEFILLHAVDIPMLLVPIVALAVAPSKLREECAESATKRLEELAARMRDEGLRIRVETDMGDPATVITNSAGSESVDLVAVGRRGTSKIESLLIGSIAQRVMQHAPCPVLIVPETSASD